MLTDADRDRIAAYVATLGIEQWRPLDDTERALVARALLRPAAPATHAA